MIRANANDPRPGMAEGREQAHVNRAETSVVELHFDDQCPSCTTLARWMAQVVKVDATGTVRLAIDCTHYQVPSPETANPCGECSHEQKGDG
jgi:hypothetical protein